MKTWENHKARGLYWQVSVYVNGGRGPPNSTMMSLNNTGSKIGFHFYNKNAIS